MDADKYQAEVRRLAALRATFKPRRTLGQRIRDLLGRPAPRPIRVTPKGVREICAVCGEPMIAGQPYLGRRLTCGPCSRHAQGNPMPPQRREDDGTPPRAA